MTLKELARQINAMPAEQQEQAALIFDDNVGRFIELTSFVVDDDNSPKTYLDEADKYFDES